ncbi:MAG: GNAT family N-acetyltransferase [Spirochaetales bacterium]|nr:GNAT family N-acetyltransferase [Spirochaetales bacterium]
MNSGMLTEVNQNTKAVQSILAQCIWKPTEERIGKIAGSYFADRNSHLFLLSDSSGLIGIKNDGKGLIEICHIAVAENMRKQGIGRNLIHEIIRQTRCITLYAETDDDAVNFYRKCGFVIKSLGEKYSGIVRYYCGPDCIK